MVFICIYQLHVNSTFICNTSFDFYFTSESCQEYNIQIVLQRVTFLSSFNHL